MHDTGCLGLVHWDNPEGWCGEGGLYLWWIHFDIWENQSYLPKVHGLPWWYETAKETLMYRSVLWTLWERERVGRFGRMALKHVKYHV